MRFSQLFVLAAVLLSGCASVPTATPRVSHINTLIEVGLVGRDRYRLSAAGELRDALRLKGEAVIGPEEFVRVCDIKDRSYAP